MTWMTCANAALPAHGVMPIPVEVAVDQSLDVMLGPWTAWLRKKLVLGEVIKGAIFHNAPSYVFDDVKLSDADMAHISTTCFRTHVFSMADTVRVAEACKRARVKVTPAVTACFLEVQGEVLQFTRKDAFRLCVVNTVNTRDFLIPRMPIAALGPYIGSTGAHYTAYNFGASQTSGLARVLTTARDLGASLVAETKPERALLRASQMSWGLDRQPVSMNAPTLVVSSWSAKGPVQPTYGQDVTVDQALFSMQCNVNSWPTRESLSLWFARCRGGANTLRSGHVYCRGPVACDGDDSDAALFRGPLPASAERRRQSSQGVLRTPSRHELQALIT